MCVRVSLGCTSATLAGTASSRTQRSSRVTVEGTWTGTPRCIYHSVTAHNSTVSSAPYKIKQVLSKSFRNSRVATSALSWTRPLCVILSVQCPLQTSPITLLPVRYIHTTTRELPIPILTHTHPQAYPTHRPKWHNWCT